MQTLYATATDAASVSDKGKAKPSFRVEVVFNDADNPQVIADGIGASLCIDAARAYAAGQDPLQTVELFGTRDESGKPSDKERILRRMLNGGSLTLSVGSILIVGTFTGYIPSR